MKIDFDSDKNKANIAKHGVDMAAAAGFDFDTAKTWLDTRQNYGEDRTVALASLPPACMFSFSLCADGQCGLSAYGKRIIRKGRHTMAKNKKPRHISQKDWDAVDSPPLSDDILAAMKPARQTFPDLAEESARRKRGERGPQKKPRKVLISLRVERSTIEAYKAAGRGYQTRMAAVLEKHAK